MQLMDYNPYKMIIVNEYALYNLEFFLEHREKALIITVNAHKIFFLI